MHTDLRAILGGGICTALLFVPAFLGPDTHDRAGLLLGGFRSFGLTGGNGAGRTGSDAW